MTKPTADSGMHMDYSKSGVATNSKKAPRHRVGVKGLGAEKSASGGKASKEELLARLKAAAEAKKTKD